MPHASWLEYLWFAVTFMGWFFIIFSLADARYDWRRFRKSQIASQRWFMKVIYQSAVIMFVVHTLIVMAAIWGIFTAPPPPEYRDVPQTLGNIIAWLLVSALLSFHAMLGRFWRTKMSEGDYNGGSAQTRRMTDTAATPTLAPPVVATSTPFVVETHVHPIEPKKDGEA